MNKKSVVQKKCNLKAYSLLYELDFVDFFLKIERALIKVIFIINVTVHEIDITCKFKTQNNTLILCEKFYISGAKFLI